MGLIPVCGCAILLQDRLWEVMRNLTSKFGIQMWGGTLQWRVPLLRPLGYSATPNVFLLSSLLPSITRILLLCFEAYILRTIYLVDPGSNLNTAIGWHLGKDWDRPLAEERKIFEIMQAWLLPPIGRCHKIICPEGGGTSWTDKQTGFLIRCYDWERVAVPLPCTQLFSVTRFFSKKSPNICKSRSKVAKYADALVFLIQPIFASSKAPATRPK